MEDKDIIFKGVFGSRLYGLDHAGSDEDENSVYAPPLSDLVFGDYLKVKSYKNGKEDKTLFAITKFLKLLEKNDPISMDMIFTPPEKIIVSSPLWEELQSYRQDILCKNCRGVIGYIKTQASKYGHKIQRYNEMVELQNLIQFLPDGEYINQTSLFNVVLESDLKFINAVPQKGVVWEHIDVCGSKYQTNAKVKYLKQGLESKIKTYGNRTKKGAKEENDTKSLSHALRVLIQMDEWITTKTILFPLSRSEEIMKVKMGELSKEQVVYMIDTLYDEVMVKLENSDLPEDNNMSRIKGAVMNYYDIEITDK